MQCVIRNIIRKSRGGISAKEQVVDADILLIGRGNDCGIHLQDPRVLLRHAELTLRKGDVYVAPASGADVRVNGNLTQMVKLSVGDVIRIGPYDLTLEANDQHGKVTIAVELIDALAEDLGLILAQSAIRTGRISLRAMSWAFAIIVLAALFVAPLVTNLFHVSSPSNTLMSRSESNVAAAPTEMWSSGGISAAHKFFGESCETCHVTPFVPVQDITCLGCHESVEHHADPVKFAFASFEGRACQSCHKEHQGNQTIALSNQDFCVDCHKDFAARAPKSELLPVADFGTAHPEFKPTVVTDAALLAFNRDQFISATSPPREDSSLDFPHSKHLRAEGVRDPARGNVQLKCQNCHQPEGGGAYMLPISFEKHCHQCHALKFDVYVPDRELTHGKPEEMFKQVSDVYDAVAMRGGYEEPEAPPLIRRRAGEPLTPTQKKEALDWSAEKTNAILNGRFGKGQCDGCHKIFETTASSGPTGAGWGVEPVLASTNWYPKARFDHGRHRDMQCETCHQAKLSVASSDVLMPSISTCRSCHGGEHATDKVPSTCISCHGFHRKGLDPMKKTAAEAHGPVSKPVAKP